MTPSHCPVAITLSMISGKWKLLIVKELYPGPMRYNALSRKLPDASSKVLCQQLKEMESDGLVRRTAFPEVPPHVEYSLTKLGHSLVSIIVEVRRWGLLYLLNDKNLPVSCAECNECSYDGC